MCGSPTTTVIIRLILLFLDFGGKRFVKDTDTRVYEVELDANPLSIFKVTTAEC